MSTVPRSTLPSGVTSWGWGSWEPIPAVHARSRRPRWPACRLRHLQAQWQTIPRHRQKLNDAIEREFKSRRAALVEAGRSAPLERLAAFLVSLSRTNAHEGRDPTVIGESCPSVFAAGYLGLSIDDLTSLLLELERRELIKPYSGGVRLRDVGELEKLASRTVVPVRKGHRRTTSTITPRASV